MKFETFESASLAAVDEDRQFVGEASDMGFKVGEWPYVFEIGSL